MCSPLRSWTREGSWHSQMLFNTILQLIASTTRQDENKSPTDWKEDEDVFFVENPNLPKSTRISEFGEVKVYKVNTEYTIQST